VYPPTQDASRRFPPQTGYYDHSTAPVQANTSVQDPTVDLVRRAQAGDSEAFGLLYDRYADFIYRYIYRRVGNWATAEDLTSDTFMRVLCRIGIFTWQGRKFEAWLVTIARNLVTDYFKSGRVRMEISTAEMLDTAELERSPEESVVGILTAKALLEAVRELNPQQQQCVTLRFLQDLTVAETAGIMDKSHGAVKSLLCRALQRLAQLEQAQSQAFCGSETEAPRRYPAVPADRLARRDSRVRPPQPGRRQPASAAAG
jgi:RNA polymerase sigma-70 factor (ECF subfamily)